MNAIQPRKYQTVLRDGRSVGYYMDMLPSDRDWQNYMSVTIASENVAGAQELVAQGYRFSDRSIPLEIPLERYSPALKLGKKFFINTNSNWSAEEIFSLAKDSFEKDERFAVDIARSDTTLKNELLLGYIRDLQMRGSLATLMYSDAGLEGFNLWTLREGVGRVVLGIVTKHYRGTGIALSLYSQTIMSVKSAGAKMLRDIVASSNMASLNLHAMIIRSTGGIFRFGACRDIYKKEQSVTVNGVNDCVKG